MSKSSNIKISDFPHHQRTHSCTLTATDAKALSSDMHPKIQKYKSSNAKMHAIINAVLYICYKLLSCNFVIYNKFYNDYKNHEL